MTEQAAKVVVTEDRTVEEGKVEWRAAVEMAPIQRLSYTLGVLVERN